MSERRARIHSPHALPKTRRCELLEVARSSAYYRTEPVSEADLVVRNGPRKLDSAISGICCAFQAANSVAARSKYTASGVRRSSAL